MCIRDRLTTGGPALVQAVSRDTCASRSRTMSRLGQSSRSSNDIARARVSLARRDEKTRREDARVRRRASRVVRVRSRSRSTHPSRASFKGGSTREARGVARGGARDVCMCLITGLMVRTIKCSTLVFLFVKAMCGTPSRARRGRSRSARVVGRQRPAGVARRRARDGDSR